MLQHNIKKKKKQPDKVLGELLAPSRALGKKLHVNHNQTLIPVFLMLFGTSDYYSPLVF